MKQTLSVLLFGLALASSISAACPPGRYNDTNGNCLYCPDGHHCATGVATKCPLGTYSNGRYQEVTECKPCLPGDFADETGSVYCRRCPFGYKCPDAAQSPQKCPAGTFSYHPGTGAVDCTTCPDGFYQTQEGSQACLKCPDGHFCMKKIFRKKNYTFLQRF
jgi:hypothetical protein